MLEALQHTDNSFLTLTYTDEALPKTKDGSLPTLSPRHLQLWLKRFRKAIAPLKVRFFAVGEYGEETQRPHYHVILFGFPTCAWGRTRHRVIQLQGYCCPQCSLIQQTWMHGGVDLGSLTSDSAQYVAGYTIKKLTAPGDIRLKGRHPEFTRMSRDGGIGLGAIPEIASAMLALDLEQSEVDVPVGLRHGNKVLPLGQYLRRKLREHLGRDPKTPPEVIEQLEEGVQPLREIAFNASESLVKGYKEIFKGQAAQIETRAAIFKKRNQI